MEVVGTYVSFKPAAHIKAESSWHSTWAGISTFAGHLEVGDITVGVGSVTVNKFEARTAYAETLTVPKNLYATNGIVTDFKATDASITRNYSDVGITTLSHVGTS